LLECTLYVAEKLQDVINTFELEITKNYSNISDSMTFGHGANINKS